MVDAVYIRGAKALHGTLRTRRLQKARMTLHDSLAKTGVASVLVTGAGGFIGGHVVRSLAERGHPVIAGLRSDAEVDPRATPVLADICNTQDVSRAMQGCGAVVHAASGPPEVIVEGMKAVLAAAGTSAGAAKVVHLSSVSVYGAADGRFEEDTPAAGPLDAYGAAKQEAEALCREAAGRGADVVILRPGIVTGSGSSLWVQDLAARIAQGGATDFGNAGMGWSKPIHWRDLCAAIAAALALPPQGPTPSVFNVSGAERINWNTYMTRLAEALNLPKHCTGPVGLGLSKLGKLTGKFGLPLGRPSPSGSEMAVFARKADYPSTRLQQATGWRAEMSLDDIFAEIASQSMKAEA